MRFPPVHSSLYSSAEFHAEDVDTFSRVLKALDYNCYRAMLLLLLHADSVLHSVGTCLLQDVPRPEILPCSSHCRPMVQPGGLQCYPCLP